MGRLDEGSRVPGATEVGDRDMNGNATLTLRRQQLEPGETDVLR